MLLKDYKFRLVFPECNPTVTTVNAIADLTDDISEVFSYLNAIINGCRYDPDIGTLRFVKEGRTIVLYPRQIGVTKLEDEDEARQVLDSIKELINATYERRNEIEPSYRRADKIKVLDIYKLLPGSNCKECGEPTCFAFANKLVKQDADVYRCAPIFTKTHKANREKLLEILDAAGYGTEKVK